MTADRASVPSVSLHDGMEIPQLGLGVFHVPSEQTRAVVEEALQAGYRHIDTAAAYGNEEEVGRAIAACGMPREEIFVTTKLWNSEQGYDSTLRAFEESCGRLGLDYVDLYLIHWPLPSQDLFVETWRAFECIHEEEGARTIGVSNFRIEDVERLERETEKRPTVNQVELHPGFQQGELRAWHADRDIATEAWAPLAQGGFLLSDQTIVTIGDAHEKSPAQVILRWHLQLGNVVIPKSARSERIRENIEIFDFELSEEEMAAIGRLDGIRRIGPDPATFALA